MLIKRPTIEEVKEHFKNAKVVKCLKDSIAYNIEENNIKRPIHLVFKKFFVDLVKDDECVLLWCLPYGYAEIIEYKDEIKEIEVNDAEVVRPTRYSSREVNGMDVIALVKHWNLNFNEGNILKYLLRDKGQDLQDMEKIVTYAKRESEYLKTLND